MRILILLPLLLATASVAAAKSGSPATVRSAARVLICDAEAHAATFQGEMQAVEGAVRYEMRFALQTRAPASTLWSRVDGVWEDLIARDEPFAYDRKIKGLVVGAEYRAIVRSRWRNAKGRTVARAVRRTRPCRQPDTRPNLAPVRLTVSDGSRDDTRYYALRVVNSGASDAAPFAARVDIAGTVPPAQSTGEPLAPQEEEVFEFEGPRCVAGQQVTATIDPDAAVAEADETDNVLVVQCPVTT